MKNNILSFSVLVAVLLLSGCQKDAPLDIPDRQEEMRLVLSLDDQDEISTYSAATTNECLIDDVVVLLFDGTTDKYLKGACIASTSDKITGNNGDKLRTVTINLGPKPGDKIVVLVNSGKTTIPLIPGTSTRDNINDLFPLRSLAALNLDLSESGKQMPMSGEVTYNGSGQVTCPLRRSVAKVEVVLANDLDDPYGIFVPGQGYWFMGNVAKPESVGAIYASASAADCAVKSGNDFLTDLSILKDFNRTTHKLSKTYYLPEYPNATRASGTETGPAKWSAQRTHLIIACDGGYYRIDLYDHATGKFIDIRRNTHIKVTIRKVKTVGYPTIAQATNSPGSNLEYEIKVTGDNDDVVVSNGQYALSLSNDKIFIWGPNGDYEVAKIRYILPKEMTSLPAGVTCQIAHTGLSSLEIRPINVTDQAQPLIIRCSSLEVLPEGSSKTIQIRLGNIVKDFYIEFHPLMDAHGTTILFNGQASADAQWLRNENGYSFLNHTNGTFSFVAPENVTPVKWVKYDDSGNEMLSSESDPAAEPLFEYKYGEASIPYSDPDTFDVGKIKVIIGQRWPQYMGWWGGEPGQSGITYYSKRLVSESIYESLALPSASGTFNVSVAQDTERGKANTLNLMDQSQTGAVPSGFKQVYRCYMMNDLNGNGQIDPDEPIRWYLPAQNQLVGSYVQVNGTSNPTDFTAALSSTVNGVNFFAIGLFSGNVNLLAPSQTSEGRCVRDL